jgi:hypothetical protein
MATLIGAAFSSVLLAPGMAEAPVKGTDGLTGWNRTLARRS